jgi:hypothetical protein
MPAVSLGSPSKFHVACCKEFGGEAIRMHDRLEGVAPLGTIETGARRDRVSAFLEPVLDAAVSAVRAAGRDSSLYVYGSVATGMARPARSDVDLLTVESRRLRLPTSVGSCLGGSPISVGRWRWLLPNAATFGVRPMRRTAAGCSCGTTAFTCTPRRSWMAKVSATGDLLPAGAGSAQVNG